MDGQAGLLCHVGINPLFAFTNSPRINDNERLVLNARITVLAITREPRQVGNKGVATFRQLIERVDLPTLGRPTSAITGFMMKISTS